MSRSVTRQAARSKQMGQETKTASRELLLRLFGCGCLQNLLASREFANYNSLAVVADESCDLARVVFLLGAGVDACL